jgi:tripartite-type tricarboxylate transporter receptor subunit TctC/predicted MFS family arabinose efflux permease
MSQTVQGVEAAALAAPDTRPTAKRFHRGWAVVRIASGNFLENYDLTIFAYYAYAIGLAYFPASSEHGSLMLALATFGVGYVLRPLGAVVLGAYMDRYGRRPGLLLTLSLMGIGTFLIAALPPYAVIGLLAPLLVLIGRLLQGFSAGGEIGGVAVYLAEIAKPGHKGFYVSWQPASQQVGVIFAATLGYILSLSLTQHDMTEWGWRIPILIGCAIIPVFFLLRRQLDETAVFVAQTSHPTIAEICISVAANWRVILIGMLMVANASVTFYFITVYTPTFGRTALHLGSQASFLVTLLVAISSLSWQPISGALTDRIGRRPVLITAALLAMITTYPALLWLIQAPSFERLLAVELWLSFMFGFYNGANQVFLTEIMPARVRVTGFSIANALGPTVFGGFTPAISSWLIHASDNAAAPGMWLSFAALLGLTGALLARPEEPSAAHPKRSRQEQANGRPACVRSVGGNPVRKIILALIALVCGAAASTAGGAEDSYPARPVRILVGFAPAGSVDLMARFYGKKFGDVWGQSFVVENRPGAAGNIAAQIVAQAKPDGYTLLLTSVVHSINASIYSLPYDPAGNFAAISPVALAPNGIAVAPSSPIRSLAELVSYAKAHPDELAYASAGTGTLMHIGMELFDDSAGIKLVHVPFGGTGPAINAVLGAHVPVLSSGYGSAEPYAKAGTLRMLAISTAQPSPLAPGVPTVAEASGLPGYEAVGWMGLLAPAGTPKAIVDKLNGEVLRIQRSADVPEWLASQGLEPYHLSPEAFSALVQSDIEKWGKVVRRIGIKGD